MDRSTPKWGPAAQIRRFLAAEGGTTAIEYAVIAGVMGVVTAIGMAAIQLSVLEFPLPKIITALGGDAPE